MYLSMHLRMYVCIYICFCDFVHCKYIYVRQLNPLECINKCFSVMLLFYFSIFHNHLMDILKHPVFSSIPIFLQMISEDKVKMAPKRLKLPPFFPRKKVKIISMDAIFEYWRISLVHFTSRFSFKCSSIINIERCQTSLYDSRKEDLFYISRFLFSHF